MRKWSPLVLLCILGLQTRREPGDSFQSGDRLATHPAYMIVTSTTGANPDPGLVFLTALSLDHLVVPISAFEHDVLED